MFRLIRELKRRHVFRVAAVYGAVSWLVIEIVATVVPRGWFESPHDVVEVFPGVHP